MKGLNGKSALVTGGASGIGAATAKRFLGEGCQVYVLDCDSDARKRIESELPGLAGVYEADVADIDQVETAFAQASSEMGGIDILINNAGISIRHPFTEITAEDWGRVLEVIL